MIWMQMHPNTVPKTGSRWTLNAWDHDRVTFAPNTAVAGIKISISAIKPLTCSYTFGLFTAIR